MLQERKYFEYSKRVIWITSFCLSIVSILGVAIFLNWEEMCEVYSRNVWNASILLISLGALFVVFLCIPLRAPRYYILNAQGLYIKFVVGGKFYSRDSYEIDADIPYSEIRASTRAFGSGGYFGYLGLFRVPNMGVCRFYVTNEKGVLMRVRPKGGGRCIYVSQ